MGGRGREVLWLKEGTITTQLTTTPSLVDLHLHKNILIRLRMDLKSVVFYFSFFLSFPCGFLGCGCNLMTFHSFFY